MMRTGSFRLTVVALTLLAAATVAAKGGPVGNDDDVTLAIKRLASADAEERAEAAVRLRSMGAESHAAIPALVKVLGDETPTRSRGQDARAPAGKMFPSPGFEAAQ